ncbi:hypothetical protein MMC10_008578 [Thelotrema lepadinum]|nr:hypothetical protein [Thelotrema lepadinum]
MAGKSSAVAVYFKPVVAGPKKSLHLNSIFHVVTVIFPTPPTPNLTEYRQVFPKVQNVIARKLRQFKFPQEACVGIYTHDSHGLDEKKRRPRPVILETSDISAEAPEDGFSEDRHLSHCKGCRWVDDIYPTKLNEDDYARTARRIALCALSRVSIKDEAEFTAEMDKPNSERTASSVSVNCNQLSHSGTNAECRSALSSTLTPDKNQEPNAIDAAELEKQSHSTLETPFTEDDLPESEESKHGKNDYGTMFGRLKSRQIEQSDESDSSTSTEEMEGIEYDSDIIVIANAKPGKIVQTFDHVRVPPAPPGSSPSRVFQEFGETNSQSSHTNDTEMTEDNLFGRDDEDDEEGWQTKRSRDSKIDPIGSKINAKDSRVASKDPVIDLEDSSADSDPLEVFRRHSRGSLSASGRIQGEGLVSRKSIQSGISKPLVLQTKTTNGASRKSLSESSSPTSPTNKRASEQRSHARIPTAPAAKLISGLTSREPKAGEIDAIKISRDGDKIVGHRFTTGRRFIKYHLQWKPDHPDWIPALSWVPKNKFKEDPHFIEEYEGRSNFSARNNQAHREVRTERTFTAVKKAKDPKRKL